MRRLFGCPDIVSLTEKFLMARNFYRFFTENNPIVGDSKTFCIPEAKGLNLTCMGRLELGTKILWTTIMTSANVLNFKISFLLSHFIERKSRCNIEEILEFRWLHFIVNLAYARVATKRLHICAVHVKYSMEQVVCVPDTLVCTHQCRHWCVFCRNAQVTNSHQN